MNKITTTYQVYKSATGLDGKPDKRGPTIGLVDTAFKDYERVFQGQPTQQAQIAAILELYTQSISSILKASPG
jgi:hypothetical protein